MKFYTDWETGYNNDDFIKNQITVFKSFTVGEIKYTLYYHPHNRRIEITKRTPTYKHWYTVQTEMFENCYFDLLKHICDEIRAIGI